MAQQPQPTYTADDSLDLCRDWDAAACGTTPEGVRAWLEKERPHLLRSYDADFLVRAVEASRTSAGAAAR
jgi:hypothetical protein